MPDLRVKIAVILSSAPPGRVGGSELQAYKLFSILKEMGHSVFLVSKHESSLVTTWGNMELYLIKNSNQLMLLFEKIRAIFKPERDTKSEPLVIEFDDSVTTNNALVEKIPLTGFLIWFLPLLWKFFWYLRNKRRDFDIIYVPIMEQWAFIGCILGQLLNKPVIVKDATMNGISNILRFPLGKAMQKYIIKRTNKFIAISSAIKLNFLNEGISEDRIEFIPNGVEIKKLDRLPVRGRCLFIGNLYQQPAKGIDILLKSWIEIHKKNPEAQLYVVGGGEIEEYNKYIEKLGIGGSVFFMGKHQNIYLFLQEAEIIIIPSRREGLSNVLLEAMMLGIPVVASNISGNQDLIVDGVNGMLFDVNNIRELTQDVTTLLANENLRSMFSVKSKELIERKYNINHVAEEYSHLFNELKHYRI